MSRRTTLRRFRARAGQRGMSTISLTLESALIMMWFVVVILGELAVSRAATARRAAEQAAESSTARTSAEYCRPSAITVGTARVDISIISNGKPNGVSAAIAIIQALGGVGGGRTWAYYILPLLNGDARATATADRIVVPMSNADPSSRRFFAERNAGCLEKPLDVPAGTMNFYRNAMWVKNLLGY
jgi:hypothetical protein